MRSTIAQSALFSVTLAFLAFTDCGFAQRISFGSCPDFPVVTNFDVPKYTGRWFEYSRYFAIFELFGKCAVADYTDLSPPEGAPKIGVLNRGVNYITSVSREAIGDAVLADPDDPEGSARLIVNFDSQSTRSTTANYNVVDTDYESYSVVYYCSSVLYFLKAEILWILTRDQFPDDTMIDAVKDKIVKAGIDTSRLGKTDQDTCPPPPKAPVNNNNNNNKNNNNEL